MFRPFGGYLSNMPNFTIHASPRHSSVHRLLSHAILLIAYPRCTDACQPIKYFLVFQLLSHFCGRNQLLQHYIVGLVCLMAVASRWPCVICALLVAGVGISVDERDSQKDNIKSGSQRAEFEIVGTYETVLKNNMDQLQWTTLSMLLLSLSTALLGVAQEVPAQLTFHPSVLAIADGSVQDWLAFGVDLSEQV
jgi:hypothetical protein